MLSSVRKSVPDGNNGKQEFTASEVEQKRCCMGRLSDS